MTIMTTVLGTDTSIIPDVKPKSIAGLMSQIGDVLGNAQWIGIICGVLGLIIAGGMIALHNRRGPGAGGEAVKMVGWSIAGVLIVMSAPIIIRQLV